MPDREKVRKGLEWILDGDRFGFGENWHIDSEPKTEEEQAGYYIQRAIAMLKEQEAVEPKVSCTEQRCGNCNKVIEMDGWKVCPWCGKMIDWERWWKKNGTRNQDT